LKSGTELVVCAICSLQCQKGICTLVILRDSDITTDINLDSLGVVNQKPGGKSDFTQIIVCNRCFCSGKLVLKNGRYNVNGFGRVPNDLWLSEEMLISTIISFIAVKHSGGGGFSYKQESLGGACFFYQNLLDTLWMLLQGDYKEGVVAVGWVRQGQATNRNAVMLVRIDKVLEFFVEKWKSESYRVQAIQCSNGSWDISRVNTELIPLVQERLLEDSNNITLEAGVADHYRERASHRWPWTVRSSSTQRFFIKLGQGVRVGSGLTSEMYIFMHSFPSLFMNLEHTSSRAKNSPVYPARSWYSVPFKGFVGRFALGLRSMGLLMEFRSQQ